MSLCRGCGKKILWGRTAEGKNIPLDALSPVYRLGEVTKDDQGRDVQMIVRDREAFVSHFCTCPKASQFSRRNDDA